MSWLRIDDNFQQHPKFAGWKPADKWAFFELMGYCAKYKTRGRIPDDLGILPRTVTRRVIKMAQSSGWVDTAEDGSLWIHDWLVYNGQTAAEKVAAYLAANPEASANDVYRAVGGKREVVLAEVAKLVPTPVPGNHLETSQGGSSTGSRARAARTRPLSSKTLPSAGTPGTGFRCEVCGVVKRTERLFDEHLADVHGDEAALGRVHAQEAEAA